VLASPRSIEFACLTMSTDLPASILSQHRANAFFSAAIPQVVAMFRNKNGLAVTKLPSLSAEVYSTKVLS
jgi:hypothetical protein